MRKCDHSVNQKCVSLCKTWAGGFSLWLDFILRVKFSGCSFTLKGIWLSESKGPSNSTTGPDWSPDISCIVASKESAAEPSPECRTLARVSNALTIHEIWTHNILKYMHILHLLWCSSHRNKMQLQVEQCTLDSDTVQDGTLLIDEGPIWLSP